jgi:hypothetical protein
MENDMGHESDDPEMALEDRELEDWDESDDPNDSDGEDSEDDDE